ncbi:uncharacterized protein AB675_6689 [Cyphellophora attinorum]|uniref:Uncharacterized protein n=1 Tax=Cyphellophora attinorum TaxID=1664694 RepID=A0A0N1HE24_9EURO|nr:uncharacterized protein AB675_6689 [Phialophora attinorum]KPI43505.1 hypothetical protein AB675_6689 [Phialophora attinorum]
MKLSALLVGALALAPLACASPVSTDGGLSKRCAPEDTDGGSHSSHCHHPTPTVNEKSSTTVHSHDHHHHHNNNTTTSTTRFWGKPWTPKWSPVDETTTSEVDSTSATSSTISYGKLQTTSPEEEMLPYELTQMAPSTTPTPTTSTADTQSIYPRRSESTSFYVTPGMG